MLETHPKESLGSKPPEDANPCVVARGRRSGSTYLLDCELMQWHRSLGAVVGSGGGAMCAVKLRIVADDEAVDLLKGRTSLVATTCPVCFSVGADHPESEPPSRIMRSLLEAWEVG